MSEGSANEALPPPASSGLRAFLDKIQRLLGIDRAIGFTILARFWSGAAGIVTIALITKFLTPTEQGYYYTFGSLVALQIVFELGFSFVILQLASHERAHLSISPDYDVSGDAVAHARLASVIQKSVRWYSIAALLMTVILVPTGHHFFSSHQHAGTAVFWQVPWYSSVIAAAFTLQIDPILSFLEGCGYVSKVAHLRLLQAVCGSLLAWMALITHHGLFAPSMLIFSNAGVAAIWLYRLRKLLLGLLRYKVGDHRIRWGKEVWPFQWRIAISWLCGYFIFQLFNPVLFAYYGPVAAGQMGMSLNIANALQAVAVSWINTKAAPFGTMIARKEYKRLDHVFFRTLIQAVVVFLAGAFIICCADIYLNSSHLHIVQRLLRPLPLIFLLLATAINIVVGAEALYLRAHKQEKFLVNSVAGAILVGASTYFLGKAYGALGMVVGYLIIATVLGLGFGTYTFLKYRRIWHAC